jgi:uncharacterized protein (TIGR02271 family)
MVTREQFDTITPGNGDVIGQDGEKIGRIGDLYLDDDTNNPNWVTVKTGLFGTHESFVPLEGASVRGEDLVVPYTKDQVKDAPRVDPDGHLERTEEDRLYAHYGRTAPAGYGSGDGIRGEGRTEARAAGGVEPGYDEGTGTVGRHRGDDAAGTEGRDTSGPTTDDAMTRSEERLNVGTERQETGRARLRKYVTTENVTKTVPVQREEVKVEREPITDENRGAAMDGPDLSEEEHEVTLHEERPVVEKETVPVERVKLGTETTTDEETVSEDVAKEHIDADGVDGRSRRDR